MAVLDVTVMSPLALIVWILDAENDIAVLLMTFVLDPAVRVLRS